MKETFEEFLQGRLMDDEPMVLDDDLPDAYEAWLSKLDTDLLIAYAEKWCVEQKIVEVEKIFEELRQKIT